MPSVSVTLDKSRAAPSPSPALPGHIDQANFSHFFARLTPLTSSFRDSEDLRRHRSNTLTAGAADDVACDGVADIAPQGQGQGGVKGRPAVRTFVTSCLRPLRGLFGNLVWRLPLMPEGARPAGSAAPRRLPHHRPGVPPRCVWPKITRPSWLSRRPNWSPRWRDFKKTVKGYVLGWLIPRPDSLLVFEKNVLHRALTRFQRRTAAPPVIPSCL